MAVAQARPRHAPSDQQVSPAPFLASYPPRRPTRMRRAAHASVAAKHKPAATRMGSTSSSSSLRPDIEDGGQGGETDPLLDPESTSGDRQTGLPQRCAREAIFPLLHVVRQDVKSTIDTHLDWNELTSLDLNYSIVRPLALKYSQYKNVSILFVMLVNRIQFQRDADRDLALQNVNSTRASLCELLAMKLLRTFARDGFELITALTFPFSPFQGADEDTLRNEGLDFDGSPRPGQCSSALELAIFSKAKKFIKSPLCQRCVSGIYEGRVVLSYQSTHAIVDDSYKKRPLGIYDPVKAPFLDHYRLRVPLIRNRIEFINFCLLLLFYVLCLASKSSPTWTTAETIFVLWLAGFALDEVAQLQEHGLAMYSMSLYNLLDFVFCIIGFCWFGLRVSALVHHRPEQSNLSFDTLALGAILLCPRVASVLVQDNVILLALKAMLADFCFFMALAVVCFSGFLYTFWSLSGPEWTAGKIVWIMMKVWFGNSYVGFDTAQSFSPLFGPPLMVFFAVMANTLLLTILISLLSNTFSTVAQNAAEEAMYQHACLTLSGISTDALFSYMPPLNLLAIVIIMPASFILSPRWLHKVNITLLRITSWPLLLMIRLCSHGLFKQAPYMVSGSTRYMESTAEKASHLISWIPLPRSRANPDRDIIDAAFTQARARNLSPNDWEEWTASMLQIREGESAADGLEPVRSSEHLQAQSQVGEASKVASVAPDQGYGSMSRSKSVPPRHSFQDTYEAGEFDDVPGQLSTTSPLAKIFGRARRPPPPSPLQPQRHSDDPTHRGTPTRSGRGDNGKEKRREEHGGGESSSRDSSSARFQSEVELLAEQNEAASLIRSLMDKMEEHERAQRRIEGLLQTLVGRQAA